MKKLATFVLALATVCAAPALAEGPDGTPPSRQLRHDCKLWHNN
jgi:hypothetical protein